MSLKLSRERKRKPMKEAWVLRGNTLHYSLEQLSMGAEFPEVMEAALRNHDRYVAEATNLGWGQVEIEESREQIRAAVTRLVPLYREIETTRTRPLLSEVRLFKFYPEWCLEGVLDLYGPSNRSVYDLKSGSWEQDQMTFYAVLHEAYFGVKAGSIVVIEPSGRGLVDVSVTDEEIAEMKERIARVARGMKQDQFPTDGFPDKCGMCQSEPWCPATERSRSGTFA